jgi:anti-sigma B factor antagonist
MELQELDRDGHVVLVPHGRLNLVSAPPLRARIEDLIADGRTRIVVDLGAVESVDSSGLGALIGCLKVAREQGGDLRIAAAGEQVRAVLRLTNLDKILAPYDSVEEAGREW